MKRDSKTQTLSELIHASVFSQHSAKNKINSVIKHSTIFSFWESIVGAKFSKFTKPYSIKYNKLYVSAKSPIIIQELNLYKRNILNKVNSYSRPLGIEITDIIFNYKNYCVQNPITQTNIEDKPVWFEKTDVQNVELEQEKKEAISKNIDKINFLSDEQKEKLTQKIIENEKAKTLQENSKNNLKG